MENELIKVPKTKLLKSTQLFIIATTIFLSLFVSMVCIGFLMRYEVVSDVTDLDSVSYWNDKRSPEQEIWYKKGIEELTEALNLRSNRGIAKNIILFVAEDITTDMLTFARLHGLQNGISLSWDAFPYLGMLKHDCDNNMDHCDPLSIATALFGGVRTKDKLVGLDATIGRSNCTAAANETHHIEGILQMAQNVGKRTGFVTTGRVTAPTTAALYAHVPDSRWECDAFMGLHKLLPKCRDIARELLESKTGQNINVIMGGGRQTLVSNVPVTDVDPIDEMACNSRDNRNIILDWQRQKNVQKQRFEVLQNTEDLTRLNGSRIDYVMGIFANGDLRSSNPKMPQLKQMVSKAIDVLNTDEKGFLLVVNAAAKLHNQQDKQLQALLNLNEAIVETLSHIKKDLDNTLVAVLFNAGLGRASTENSGEQSEIKLQDIVDRITDPLGDTMLYAQGPKAFLLSGIHNETYLTHVASYAMNMGQFYKNSNKSS